jgi:secondary thiamine-phosphate synthase enzyme
MVYKIEIVTDKPVCMIDITQRIANYVAEKGIKAGLCNLFVPHSTAGITINSAIDDETPTDILDVLDRMAPKRTDYVHQFDSPQDAAGHVKASIIGNSLSLPIENGKLAISSSQSILFCEFDGPRHRHLTISLLAALN